MISSFVAALSEDDIATWAGRTGKASETSVGERRLLLSLRGTFLITLSRGCSTHEGPSGCDKGIQDGLNYAFVRPADRKCTSEIELELV